MNRITNSKKDDTNQSEITQTDNIENKAYEENNSLKSNIQKDSIVEIEESHYNAEEYRRESLNLSFEKAPLTLVYKLVEELLEHGEKEI